jgi:hypothetical protein
MRFDLAPRSFRPHGYGASGKISKPLLYRCRSLVNIIDRIISTGWGNFLSKNVVSFEHSRQRGGMFQYVAGPCGKNYIATLAARIIYELFSAWFIPVCMKKYIDTYHDPASQMHPFFRTVLRHYRNVQLQCVTIAESSVPSGNLPLLPQKISFCLGSWQYVSREEAG